MKRVSLGFVAGLVLGSAASYFALGRDTLEAVQAREAPPVEAPRPARAASEPSSAPAFAAQRLAIYEQAAALADASLLTRSIEAAAAEPPSRLRAVRLEALLLRLAELAPDAAARLARTLRADPRLLARLHAAWARGDAQAALAELALVTPAGTQREVALELLAVLGGRQRDVERIAASLRPDGRFNFRVAALLARAARDPEAALTAALDERDLAVRAFLVSRIAASLAADDPRAALVAAASIENPELKNVYVSSIAAIAAARGTDALLAFVEAAQVSALENGVAAALDGLALTDPELALGLLERLPPALRDGVRQSALSRLAETDPLAAAEALVAVPPGRARDALLAKVATFYARVNAEAALAWSQTLAPPSPEATAGVLREIASIDLGRALDLLTVEIEAQRQTASSAAALIRMLGGTRGERAAAVLDRVVAGALDERQKGAIVQSAVRAWATADHAAAMSWAIDNAGRLEGDGWSNIARNLGRQDAAAAALVLDRLPAASALAFVERQKGLPGYEAGLNEALRAVAVTDPQQAARLLGDAGETAAERATSAVIAGAWAAADPFSASQWAHGLRDETLRGEAIGSIARVWGEADVRAASDWVVTLAAGPARDAGLHSLLKAGAARGTVDLGLLAAYSSDRARQGGVANALLELARTDPDEARRLAALHVTDERLRATVERMLGECGQGCTVAGAIVF